MILAFVLACHKIHPSDDIHIAINIKEFKTSDDRVKRETICNVVFLIENVILIIHITIYR